MIEFTKIRLNDAEIFQVLVDDDKVLVNYRNWQGKANQIVFEEVAGYQSFSVEGKALSHGTVENEDPFLSLACEMAEEDSASGFKVYSFVSAWNDAKILRVVAKRVKLST